MSRPQPTRKQMILQQVMLMVVVFLGLQLFCNPQRQSAVDTKGVVVAATPKTVTTNLTLTTPMMGDVLIVPGGQRRIIESNTVGANSTVTLKQPLDVVPPAGSQIAISNTRTSQEILGDPNNPGAGAPPPATNPNDQVNGALGTMYWADASLNWSTLAQQIKPAYEKAVNDEADGAKKGTKDSDALKAIEDQRKQKLLLGDVILADAQYKYAAAHNDTNAMRNAFNTLQGHERELQGTPLWTTTFQIPPTFAQPERFPWRQLSGKDLYDRVVTDLSERNKKDLTYGVFPGYAIIDWLVALTGRAPDFSYAFAAFLLALLVRAAIYPLAQKQLMWGRRMQQLAPLLKEIREQYTDKKTKQVTNQVELQQKTMALYSEYGMNPFAGCLPMFVQLPLFLTVYQFMLHYQFEFQKGHFLWINPSTGAGSHGFIAENLGFRDPILVVIYGITMVTSTLLMPVNDPTQVKQQRLMGVGMGLLITFFMFTGAFPTPAAFVLYWVFTNLLATLQSLRAYRLPIPPLEKVNTKSGGVFPMPPFSNGQTNGKPKQTTITTPTSTGTPAKHKPKKRK